MALRLKWWTPSLYLPPFNEERDVSKLHELISSHPLGCWSAIASGEVVVNHIPFVLHKNRGEYGTLVGHIAKANKIWCDLDSNKRSVVVFQGEQSYISPSWYPSKHEHGRAVPTWNYVVVHARGLPQLKHDPGWLLAHLNELTDKHESGFELPWKVSDAPKAFIDKLCNAIVGIEIPLDKITGKWKLGQNRSESDQLGVISGLHATNRQESIALAEQLRQQLGRD